MKKMLVLLLTLCLLAGMVPLGAGAEETEDGTGPWKVEFDAGAQYYSTFEDALEAVKEQEEYPGSVYTIFLTKDTAESITIDKEDTAVVNIEGNVTLTNEKGKHTITVKQGGSLLIEGRGTVDNVSHGKGAVYNSGYVELRGDVTFDRSKENGSNDSTNGGNSWYTICNHGEMEISGNATVTTAGGGENLSTKGRYSSLVENGYYDWDSKNESSGYVEGTNNEYPSLTIEGGNFSGGLNTIKNDDHGVVEINNGNFGNYYHCVVMNHHKATVTGGTFTAAEGSNNTTYGIYNCACASEHDIGELEISGGTFSGADFAVADVSSVGGKITISKGSFLGTKGAIGVTKGHTGVISISGGTFSSDVSQYTEEGYTTVQKDGKYVVEKLDATNAVAQVGKKYFSSLEGAWTYALQQKTETIILHKDVTRQSKLTMDQGNTSITLDLNGHDIGFAKNCNFSIYQGKLDIIGTGTIGEEEPYYGPVMLYGSDSDVSNYTVLSVGENVTLKGWSGLFIDQLETNSNGANAFGIVATVHGTLSSVKDTTGAGGHALYINGTIKATSGNVPKITLDGATLTTVQGNGMYLAGYAETKITDSVITSASEGSTGIEIRAGKLEITNSTVTGGNGKYTGAPNGNGSTSSNVALAVAQHTTKLPIDVTIHSGTFTANAAFIEANPQKNTTGDIAKIKLNIEGGNFNGLVFSEDKTGFIKNGYFTSDPSKYCAEGLTGVANTGSNSSTYPFTVGESKVKVETAVAAGEPSVDVPEDISGVTDVTVKEAVKAKATQTSLQNAATLAGLSNDPSVVGTESTAREKLTAAGVTIGGETVTVVVQPYLDVKVEAATTTSMTVEISAKYNVIATTADDPEKIELEGTEPGAPQKNAVIISKNQKMDVTSPVTITLPLPDGFVTAATKTIYVQHKGYEYEADVTSKAEGDGTTTYTATFTNPHGFSTFVFSTKSETVATVNDTNYTNFQQAIKDAGSSNTITVKQGDLSANGVTHDLKLENGTGDEITVTINGEKITIPAGGTKTFTYTAPTPPRPTEEKHSITISTDGKGQVTGPASAAEDDKVTLTVKPNADKELYDLKVTDEDGKAVTVTKVNDTTYTFTMPDGKVTVAATFGCDGGDNCPSKAFTDLGDKQWYHDSIDYAVEHGLLEGTSPTTMEPNATLIRAQLAQILYNIEDKPAVTGEMVFEDVPASEWFYSPVLWANQNDIINGTSPITFEPLEAITRQDLALMLYRYAGEPKVTGDLDGFTDADKVGDWAEEAMAWAVAEGIVQGDTPTTLNPTGTATRAEAAAMLQRFLENAA